MDTCACIKRPTRTGAEHEHSHQEPAVDVALQPLPSSDRVDDAVHQRREDKELKEIGHAMQLPVGRLVDQRTSIETQAGEKEDERRHSPVDGVLRCDGTSFGGYAREGLGQDDGYGDPDEEPLLEKVEEADSCDFRKRRCYC